ncbi:MAG TPA: hypothetical protein DCS82_03995 [Rhodospirillaceae bacterium]|nr:hypothetical protein [Rhodospirillaceae bacterium]HAA92826.1 hypothetical protein [Rhodospirillaceae bacterium]HAT34854.1 hypothetical protein [Rhodospirillaceae bacterium]
MKRILFALTAISLIAFSAGTTVAAPTLEQRMKLLEQTLQDLLSRDAAKDREIQRLRRALKANGGGHRVTTTKGSGGHGHGHKGHGGHKGHDDHKDHAGHTDEKEDKAVYSTTIQGRRAALDWIGVAFNAAAGYSSEPSAVSQNLQAGGHDPKATGFRLQSADFSMIGSVERAFDAELHIAFVINQLTGGTGVELEEAFMRTNSLPYGFDIEAGQMFTEFGVLNPQHLHDWAWIDQPVVNSRMFGGDGARQTGVRIGWKTPMVGPWYAHLHVGAQNPTGETMKSFLGSDEALSERARRKGNVNGIDDLVYLTRFDNRLELGKAKVRAGFSGLFGPNATGPSGNTQIYGADLTVNYPIAKMWDLRWTNEFMYRRYRAQRDVAGGTGTDTLIDHGLYSQIALEYGNKYWLGFRYERATGSGDEPARDGSADLDQRQRFSPILGWRFAPRAHLRFQYNYDKADHLNAIDTKEDTTAHAFWVGLGWTFGAGEQHHDHGH